MIDSIINLTKKKGEKSTVTIWDFITTNYTDHKASHPCVVVVAKKSDLPSLARPLTVVSRKEIRYIPSLHPSIMLLLPAVVVRHSSLTQAVDCTSHSAYLRYHHDTAVSELP